MNKDQLKKLIKEQKSNHTLDQSFYSDKSIFKLDLEKIFFKQWVFVGHVSRIPKVGDFFLFNIGKESIIIIRDKNDVIHAHYNVCRHRGSHICLQEEGNKKLLVCPYHAWSYNLDGSINSARLMEKNFDPNFLRGVYFLALQIFMVGPLLFVLFLLFFSKVESEQPVSSVGSRSLVTHLSSESHRLLPTG